MFCFLVMGGLVQQEGSVSETKDTGSHRFYRPTLIIWMFSKKGGQGPEITDFLVPSLKAPSKRGLADSEFCVLSIGTLS